LRLTGVPSQRNSVAADPVRSKIVRLPLQPGTHYLDGSISQLAVHRSEFTKYLPHSVSASNYGNYDDPAEIELYDRMLRETDFARQRQLMRQFEKLVLDTAAHEIFLLWRYRIVPYRSYVKGWKVSPSHYVNQDLATIWLDK
jgi:ABC-type transport system substrate-binding protein